MEMVNNYNPETDPEAWHFDVEQFSIYVADCANLIENVNQNDKKVCLERSQYIGPLISSELSLHQPLANKARFVYEGKFKLSNDVKVSDIQDDFFTEFSKTCKQHDKCGLENFFHRNARLFVASMPRGPEALARVGIYENEKSVLYTNEGASQSTGRNNIHLSLAAPDLDDLEEQYTEHFKAHVTGYMLALDSLVKVLYGGTPDQQTFVMTPEGPLYFDLRSEQYEATQKFKRKVLSGKSREAIEQDSSVNDVRTAEDVIASGITFEDIGGLEQQCEELKSVAKSFMRNEAMKKWGAKPPQGVFFYGPPGTGKTTLAKALANEIGGNLWEIKTSEIHDKWLGNSEKNMQALFDKAKKIDTPTVMFFDEFESMINSVNDNDSSGGRVVNAVVGIFKKEIENLRANNPNIIVVGATNHYDRIDETLIRAGRFDLKLYIPLPDDRARNQIFSTKIGGMITNLSTDEFSPFADDLDVNRLAGATDGMSGADIVEVIRRVAFDKAVNGPDSPITQKDLLRSIRAIRRQ